jgi:hypothetical protein
MRSEAGDLQEAQTRELGKGASDNMDAIPEHVDLNQMNVKLHPGEQALSVLIRGGRWR